MVNEIKYRHCMPKECPEFYKQGKQVSCRLYELDLLHGRKRLTPLEVSDWKTKSEDACYYQLPLNAQTPTKRTEPKRKGRFNELDISSTEHLFGE